MRDTGSIVNGDDRRPHFRERVSGDSKHTRLGRTRHGKDTQSPSMVSKDSREPTQHTKRSSQDDSGQQTPHGFRRPTSDQKYQFPAHQGSGVSHQSQEPSRPKKRFSEPPRIDIAAITNVSCYFRSQILANLKIKKRRLQAYSASVRSTNVRAPSATAIEPAKPIVAPPRSIFCSEPGCSRRRNPFYQQGDLDKHMDTHRERTFCCNLPLKSTGAPCRRRFTTKNNLRHHQSATLLHRGAQLASFRLCPHCATQFPYAGLLQRHIREKHNQKG